MTGTPPRKGVNRLFRTAIETLLVVLVLAIFPYTGDPAGDIKDLALRWGASALGAAWLFVSWRRHLPARRPPHFFPALAAFLLLNLIAAARSPYPDYSFIEMRRYLSLFLLYFVASQVFRTTNQVRRLMAVLCWAMTVSAAYAFLQKAGVDFFPWSAKASDEYRNLPAAFGNPNYAAHVLILAIIFALYLAAAKGHKLYLVVAGVLVAHLYFTHQRGGLVALAGALALVVSALAARRMTKKPVRAAVAALLMAAAIAVLAAGAVMLMLKVRTGTAYPLDLSLLVRYKSYCSASRMILERPLLGHGPGVYQIAYPRYWTRYEQDWFAQERKMNTHVHNDPLETACDAGLPAAGLYIAFLVFGMGYGILMAYTRRDPRARRMGYAFAAFFAAFLIDGCFGFNLRVPVSAAVLFIVAGAMEGLVLSLSRPPAAKWNNAVALSWRAGVAALALYCAWADTKVFASEMRLQQGRGLVLANKLAEAQAAFAAAESLAPWNAQFPLQLGLIALAKKDTAAAVQHLERAHERNPASVVIMTQLARTELAIAAGHLSASEKDVAEASRALDDVRRHAEAALALCPQFAQAEELLGRSFLLRAACEIQQQAAAESIQSAWNEAALHLGKAIAFGVPKQAELYRLQSRARAALGDTAGAEEALVRSAQADPADAKAWEAFFAFARQYARFDALRDTLLGQLQRMNETPDFDPGSVARAYLWLAAVRQEGYRDLDGAEKAFREAARKAPALAEVWTAYAAFAERCARMDAFYAALIGARKVMADESAAPVPAIEAAALAHEGGAPAITDAANRLINVWNARPADEPAEKTAAELRWAARLVRADARKAFAAAPRDAAQSLLSLAVLHDETGDAKTAEELYRQAMPFLDPENQMICVQYWAPLLARSNRAQEAIDLLRVQLERYPDNVGLNLALAQAYAVAGAKENASAQYRRLLDIPGLNDEVRHVAERELRGLSAPNAGP